MTLRPLLLALISLLVTGQNSAQDSPSPSPPGAGQSQPAASGDCLARYFPEVFMQIGELRAKYSAMEGQVERLSTQLRNTDRELTQTKDQLAAMAIGLNSSSPGLAFTGEAGTGKDYRDGAIICFGRVLANAGNMYNRSSCVVHIPKDGVYVIYFRTDPPGGSSRQAFDLKVNGVHQIFAYGESGHLGSGMVSLPLRANDQIMITKRDGANNVGYAAVLTVVRVST